MVAVNPYEHTEARARQGDMQAFGRLIRAWDGDLRGVAWSITRSAGDTDDVMQSTYEKAVRSLPGFRGSASLKTWLHRICYRTAIDHIRFESRRRHEPTTVLEDRPGAHSTSDAALAGAELAAILESLDTETRAALMLTAGLGYSFDDAAAILQQPRGTIASKVRRARLALQAPADPAEEAAR